MSEYKEALAWVEQTHFLKLPHKKTIRKALRLADKVTGEPSEGMIEATITSFNDNGKLALVSHAKAYINQAIRELEDE